MYINSYELMNCSNVRHVYPRKRPYELINVYYACGQPCIATRRRNFDLERS